MGRKGCSGLDGGWKGLDRAGGNVPPLDSKLGMPCMMTWCRKRGLLFILMLPDSSPLK